MTSKILVLGVVGTGCLVASGIGGYLAVKSAPAPAVASAAVQPVASSSDSEAVPTPRQVAAPPERTVEPATTSQASISRTAPVVARSATTRAEHATPAKVGEPVRSPEPSPVAAAAPAPSPIPAELPLPEAGPIPVDTAASAPLSAPAPKWLVVPEDAVIGIRLETAVTSETAAVEDRVRARVTRDVRVDDEVAIPSGATLEGTVTLVERGGRFKDRSRVGIQFTTLVIDDARLPIQTEAIFRDGEPPTREATSKIGASAVVGTILGAVIGGKKGAAIGGTAGAAGGTAAVMAGGRNEAAILEGASLTVRLTDPVTITRGF
jgi:hypothetical protein